MENFKQKNVAEKSDKEIVFSQSIKAGKRIYYIDVKKNRKDEMFLAITESKKIVSGEGEDALVSFEKHKIFLYKEDFEKFILGLQQAVDFVKEQQDCLPRGEEGSTLLNQSCPTAEEAVSSPVLDEGEIKIDIDF